MPSHAARNRSRNVLFLASAILVAAALLSPRAHAACGGQHDFLVHADPLLASVRPADCATVLDGPPQFTWPMQDGRNTYTIALHFPDGHTETRSTSSNWLAWDRAVPAGNYTWSVSVTGPARSRSEPRGFRVERGDASSGNYRARVTSSTPAPRPAQGASIAAPAESLFRFEPSESWVPSAGPSRTPRKAAVGGFFGGFTE